jgi:hypothetical protein
MQLINDLHDLEETIEKTKVSIIKLKNDVYYGYVDKSNAYSQFEVFRNSLIENTELLSETYKTYIDLTAESVELPKLEKEYLENLILYKTKLKVAEKADHKLKKKLVAEAVRIAFYLQQLYINKHNDK